MPAQALLFLLAAVAVAVAVAEANLEAVVDVAMELLEDMDVEDDTSPIHQDAPIAAWTTTPPKIVERHRNASCTHQDALIAIWTTTPLKNAERHQNRPATPLESVKAVIIVPKADTYVQIAQ